MQIEGKGKDKPAEPDVAKVGWLNNRLQENLLKSVSFRFSHGDVIFLENVSARSRLVHVGSCPVKMRIAH